MRVGAKELLAVSSQMHKCVATSGGLAGVGTEGATFSSAMCRYQHYFVEKILESCNFPEYLTDVYTSQLHL